MNKLRVYYKLDGVDLYEDIDPDVDICRMYERADLYKDCLVENGAREIQIRWLK